MSTARQRRLHGLAVPNRATTVLPPAAADSAQDAQKPQTPTAAPNKDATRGRGRSQGASSRTAQAGGDKHRRAVTVPAVLVEQLRRRAQELDRYHTDLILDCLAATATELEHTHKAQAPAEGTSPFARPRRQAHRGRTVTTLTLYLTRAEVDAMDALAGRLGLTRSGLVTRAPRPRPGAHHMSADTPFWPSDGDAELAELRGRLRGRWKAERRAQEREAIREQWLERDLIDAVADAMHHGSRISVHLPGGRALTGHVIACGRDYATLRQDQQPPREVAIRLADHTRIQADDPYAGPHLIIDIHQHRPTSTPPEPPANPPPTFQAVLHQYDFYQQADPARQVELGTLFHPGGLVCHLHAHAGDHLYVQDRNHHHLLIPAAIVTYITWTTAQAP